MNIEKINTQQPELNLIKKAAHLIKNGGIVVYPTDTCYGIGVSAFDDNAIYRLIKLKGRDFNNPMSVIVRNLRVAKTIAEINNKQEKYFNQKLPGKFTLIFKKKKIISNLLTADKNTVGVRMPDYYITELLSHETIIPYTTTSANISGKAACYSIDDFLEQIDGNQVLPDLILDVGRLPENNLSQIIDLTKQKPLLLHRK